MFIFHRLFSLSLYKNKKIPLGEMTLTKDFVTNSRGDLYPLIGSHNASDYGWSYGNLYCFEMEE